MKNKVKNCKVDRYEKRGLWESDFLPFCLRKSINYKVLR